MMKNQKTLLVLSGALIITGLFVFVIKNNTNNTSLTTQSNKPQVVTSFYPLFFFASQIAPNLAEVTNITPAGAEPHNYEPTAQDVARIEESDLLILNGGDLEAWAENLKQNINTNKTKIVSAGEGLTTEDFVEEGQKITDPHIWLSPILALKMVDKITLGLIEVDSANTSHYQSNAEALKLKLSLLDTHFRQGLSSCQENKIITSHEAFGYLASAYNFNQIAITGLSPEEEPSPKKLTEIAKFAKTNKIKYIFFESLVSPKLSQTIATEVGAETLVLNPLEGLTPNEISEGKDYFTEMENNLTNLKIALQCK